MWGAMVTWEPIRAQYSGHVTSIDQSQASITHPYAGPDPGHQLGADHAAHHFPQGNHQGLKRRVRIIKPKPKSKSKSETANPVKIIKSGLVNSVIVWLRTSSDNRPSLVLLFLVNTYQEKIHPVIHALSIISELDLVVELPPAGGDGHVSRQEVHRLHPRQGAHVQRQLEPELMHLLSSPSPNPSPCPDETQSQEIMKMNRWNETNTIILWMKMKMKLLEIHFNILNRSSFWFFCLIFDFSSRFSVSKFVFK